MGVVGLRRNITHASLFLKNILMHIFRWLFQSFFILLSLSIVSIPLGEDGNTYDWLFVSCPEVSTAPGLYSLWSKESDAMKLEMQALQFYNTHRQCQISIWKAQHRVWYDSHS